MGSINAPGTDILAIVKSFNIPSEFPPKVITQAGRVPDHVLDADRDGRMDLTHLQTVTIDGEDAKDLDDAISLTKEGDIYHLGEQLCSGRQRTGQRSTKERNQCVPCRPCDPDASGAAFKWNLFTEPGRGSTDFKLSYGY